MANLAVPLFFGGTKKPTIKNGEPLPNKQPTEKHGKFERGNTHNNDDGTQS